MSLPAPRPRMAVSPAPARSPLTGNGYPTSAATHTKRGATPIAVSPGCLASPALSRGPAAVSPTRPTAVTPNERFATPNVVLPGRVASSTLPQSPSAVPRQSSRTAASPTAASPELFSSPRKSLGTATISLAEARPAIAAPIAVSLEPVASPSQHSRVVSGSLPQNKPPPSASMTSSGLSQVINKSVRSKSEQIKHVRTLDHLDESIRTVCESITKLLSDRPSLKKLVVHFFKQALTPVETHETHSCLNAIFGGNMTTASAEQDVSEQPKLNARRNTEHWEAMGMDLDELNIFVNLLSLHMGLPPYAFGKLEDAFDSFDFDGDGKLNIPEIYKFVKFCLREYREELGGEPEEVEIPWQSPVEAGYQILNELGKGNFGIAKLAKDQDGEEVCVKMIRKQGGKLAEHMRTMIEEYNRMSELACDLVAGSQTMFQDKEFFYMICDLERGGCLTALRQNAEKQYVDMTEDWWRHIFKQCAEALKFIHQQAVMHCDIKEDNIMVKNTDFLEPKIVVIDLGVSTPYAHNVDGAPCGTPGYVPPETLTDLKWFPRGDVFSLGVTFFQLISGMTPPKTGVFMTGKKNAPEIFLATLTQEPPWDKFDSKEYPEFKEVLASMLEKHMMQRPTAGKILQHDWFTCESSDSEDEVACGATPTEHLQKKVHPMHAFASIGITKSMLKKIGEEEDQEEAEEGAQMVAAGA